MKVIAAIAVATMLTAASSAAEDAAQTTVAVADQSAAQAGATNYVSDLVGTLSELAATPQGAEREAGLAAVLRDRIATRRMQRYILSPKYRREASEAQLASYDELFEDYIVAEWAGQIDSLVTRTIDVREAVEVKPGDIVVRSKILNARGSERASVDWRVLDIDGEMKLVDVMINGASFNVDRRAQISALIANQGFDALLAHMEESIGVS
ncbi:MAG: ABC transporter substrate-binding protein [Pseudomonadota bacterium]